MKAWFFTVMLSFTVLAQTRSVGFVRTLANIKPAPTTSVCVTWNKRDFIYRVDVAGSARTPGESEFVAIDDAFATWSAASANCSDLKFVKGDRILKPAVGKGSESERAITFRERLCRDVVPLKAPCLADGSCSGEYACWDISSSIIGLTTVTYSTRTGIAVDADIELNAASFLMTAVASPACPEGREVSSCVAYDVQNTLTHELGHALGFDHVDDPKSTMYASAPSGETAKRILDYGSQDGLCNTYPKGQPPLGCDEQAVLRRKVVARNSACDATNALDPMLWLTVAALEWRRRVGKKPAERRAWL
jgi:Matrixin